MRNSFSCEAAKQADSAVSRPQTAFSLALIIPTKERDDVIRWYVGQVRPSLKKFGVDLIVVGAEATASRNTGLAASPDSPHVFCCALFVEERDFTLEKKIFSSAVRFAPYYDYLWFCRDRSAPDFEHVYGCLQKAFTERDCDFVVLYPHASSERAYVQKHYTDPCEFFCEQYGNMTSLGSIVFRTSFLQKLMIAHPWHAIYNADFWLPSALFAYIANVSFKCDYIDGCSFVQYPKEQFSSWVQKSFLGVWGTRWKTVIEHLPSRYDAQKSYAMCHENWSVSPFIPYFLLAAKSSGGLNPGDVWRHRHEIVAVTRCPFFKIFCIALIPKYIAIICFKLKAYFKSVFKKQDLERL